VEEVMNESMWPEQEFVYDWAKKWGIRTERKALLELAERMTKPRIELQDIRDTLNKYFKNNKMT